MFGWCAVCGLESMHSKGADMPGHRCIPNQLKVHEIEGQRGARCMCGRQPYYTPWEPISAEETAALESEREMWPVF